MDNSKTSRVLIAVFPKPLLTNHFVTNNLAKAIVFLAANSHNQHHKLSVVFHSPAKIKRISMVKLQDNLG